MVFERRFAACLLVIAGCHKAEEKKEEQPPVVVRAERPRRGPIARTVDASGTLEAPPGSDVKLGAPVAGRLGSVKVAPGDRVQAGQLLASLDLLPLNDALRAAEAQAVQARAQRDNAAQKLSRARQAFDAGVASRQEGDDAQLALASAEAAVHSAEAAASTARNQVARAGLRAPFAGIVAALFAAPGEPVDQGKPIVQVAQVSRLELQARLSPADAVLVKPGQSAAVVVPGLERELAGEVLSVAPALDPATGTALARVRVDNPGGALKLGAVASARIEVGLHASALTVPRAALLSGEGGSGAAVLVVDANKAARREVELGYAQADRVEIASGLDGGEPVIDRGAYSLPEGTPVSLEGADAGAQIPEPK